MLTIYKDKLDRYFVLSSTGEFQELIPAGINSEATYEEGFTRLYDGYSDFIFQEFSGSAFFHDCSKGISNWADFPELHNVPVFACCSHDRHGDNYEAIARELGLRNANSQPCEKHLK